MIKHALGILALMTFTVVATAQIKQQSVDTAALPDGPYEAHYDNGQLKVKGSIKDGHWDGENTWYYSDGALESKGFYRNGKPHGQWESYYDSGLPEKKGTYVDGEWDGRYLWYTRKGKITETIYRKGEIIRGDREVSKE